MTNARTWTISVVALLVLVAAAFVVTSAVSFAQESPTETPVATADVAPDAADATDDSDAADDASGNIAVEPVEGSDSDNDTDDSDESDRDGSGRDCPNKDGRSDDTSTETATN